MGLFDAGAQRREAARPVTWAARLACMVGLCLLGGALLPASAQTAAKPPVTKKPLLTREELRACMAAADRLKLQRAEITEADAQLSTEEAAIAREGDALKQAREGLDLTNAEAVAAYNARLGERGRLIDQYNARLAAWRTRSQTVADEDLAYRNQCAGRDFDERDELAIRKGK